MKPAPIIPTRIGLPSSSRFCSARSTMIIASLSNAHAPLELRLDRVEPLPATVLLGDLADRQRPGEAEPGVVVCQAALGVGGVELADLVAGLGFVLERLVAVAEALG